jgi:hypothetical protein
MHRREVEKAEKAKILAEERDERARSMEIEITRLELEARRMDENG